MQEKFDSLVREIKDYNFNENDLRLLLKAWQFLLSRLENQDDPKILHLLDVARILSSWKLDVTSIVSCLLHFLIDERIMTPEDIGKEFGEEIERLTRRLARISHLKLRGTSEEEFVENLRKMFLAMAKDLRVVLVRIAERLNEMRNLWLIEETDASDIAKETLEIFAPLAERLGMGEIKAELEDLSFPFVFPDKYQKVKDLAQPHYKKAEKHILKMKKTLHKALIKEGIEAKIGGRKKHLYSLWRKLERPEIDWDFEKIYDIVALRILVETIPLCYASLGVVHVHYKPVPHLGISDFIAQPKPNGYRSIHTRVFGPSGRIVEVQIRTFEMHEEAEYGIAAHWAYSQAKSKGAKDVVLERGVSGITSSKLSWVKQLVRWRKEISDSKEFLNAVKFDALSHRIFVFSPKGDVYDLPLGSTPVDFAYAVHSDLGNYINQAKVNGKIAPLDYKLKSGDVCEIIKSKKPKSPNYDWLSFVATTLARKSILKELKKLGKL